MYNLSLQAGSAGQGLGKLIETYRAIDTGSEIKLLVSDAIKHFSSLLAKDKISCSVYQRLSCLIYYLLVWLGVGLYYKTLQIRYLRTLL